MDSKCMAFRLATATACAAAGVGAVATAGAQPALREVADARAAPTFSHPAQIDNPWLPLSKTKRRVLRGTEGGKPKRSVLTLLKRTKTFKVRGTRVRAAIVEDRAFENGKLHEVALDYYAQADNGTVHYLGEDVDIYNTRGPASSPTTAPSSMAVTR